MSANAKKEYGSTIALLLFGVMAFYVSATWLLLLIPLAVFVWCASSGPAWRRDRN